MWVAGKEEEGGEAFIIMAVFREIGYYVPNAICLTKIVCICKRARAGREVVQISKERERERKRTRERQREEDRERENYCKCISFLCIIK